MEIIGNWRIISTYRKDNHTFCKCKCDICGCEKTIREDSLKKHPPKCICDSSRKVDYTGRTFGYLKVVERDGADSYLCECICGKALTINYDDLRQRVKLSCGCQRGGQGRLYPRICKDCGKTFEGGPRAWYCGDCRKIRKKLSAKESKERNMLGKSLKIGSEMRCEMCGESCIRNAARQRFCPECAEINNKAVDREQSLKYYHENKDTINPKRYELRRKK